MRVEVEDSDESFEEEVESRIETTEEELEGFYIVKSIVREVVAPDRIGHRDTISVGGSTRPLMATEPARTHPHRPDVVYWFV